MYARSREVRGSVSSPTEVLVGLIDHVTFHNPDNGFCVLRVKARGQRDLITITGHAAMISAGEFVQASGSWINDRTNRLQCRASFLEGYGAEDSRGHREISRRRSRRSSRSPCACAR
jgi:hypothetical protein